MRNRFYFDELYQATVIRLHDFLAAVADWFDRWIIAGLAVRGTHGTTELAGRALRLLQTGNLQTYAFLFALGVALVLYLPECPDVTNDHVMSFAHRTSHSASARLLGAAIAAAAGAAQLPAGDARRGHAGHVRLRAAGAEDVPASSRPALPGYQFEQQVPWVTSPGHQLPRRRGRHQRRPDPDGRHRGLRRGLCLLGDQGAREGVLHPAAGHGGRHPGRLRLARPVLLLLLPRTGAGAHLHHDWRLGPRRAEELRHVPDHPLPQPRRAHRAGGTDRALPASPAPARSTFPNSPSISGSIPFRWARRTSSSRCCCSASAFWSRSGRFTPGRRSATAPLPRPPPCSMPACSRSSASTA